MVIMFDIRLGEEISELEELLADLVCGVDCGTCPIQGFCILKRSEAAV